MRTWRAERPAADRRAVHSTISALSEYAVERGRLSLAARLRRLRSKSWMIGQCAIAAGVAWVVATEVFGHQTPFFAPVAAFLGLGTSYGQRLRRVGEVTIGVAVGIGVADVFRHIFGQGSWQIVVVVAAAMSAAILLDASQLFISQAAVQSIVVTTLLPLNQGPSRIADALIGGGVALLAATIVPGAPLRRPREQAAKVTLELARLLRSARQSALEIDVDQAEGTLSRARETEALLDELRAAASEGLDIVSSSALGQETARASEPLTLSAAVVLAQLRSLIVDLLQLSGLTYADAVAQVPNR